MRILIFGRGVIGTIYGHALQTAGHDVEFYVRPGRVAEYGPEVQVDLLDARRNPFGRRARLTVPTRLRDDLTPADAFDLVILSVSHHRLLAAAEFLAPRIGNATVLVFGAIWDDPLDAIGPLPPAQVVFGFPQAGGGFTDDGVLHGALLRSVIIGKVDTTAPARAQQVRAAFKQAGFPVQSKPDLRGWLLLHFIANVGVHAQGLCHGGLAGLIGNRRALNDALLTSRELLPVVEARGVDLSRHRATVAPYRLPGLTAAGMAWATRTLGIARASLAAQTDPMAAEPQAILRDALAAARQLGIPTPRLDATTAAYVL